MEGREHMSIHKSIFLSMIGALAFSSTAFAQATCAYTVAVPAGGALAGQIVSSTGAGWASFTGANPAPGTPIDFTDARFTTEAGSSVTLDVMGQTIEIGELKRVQILQQDGSVCVEIAEYIPTETPAAEAVGAEVTTAPAMPAITIPLVIAGGVGAAYMLGDDGEGSSSD
jgi:hypothetical protein